MAEQERVDEAEFVRKVVLRCGVVLLPRGRRNLAERNGIDPAFGKKAFRGAQDFGRRGGEFEFRHAGQITFLPPECIALKHCDPCTTENKQLT